MKSALPLLLCALLLDFVTLAHSGGSKNVKEIVSRTSETKGVELSISVPKVSVAGSTIELTIKIQNNRKEPITYRRYGRYVDYELKIVNSKGKPVRYTEFGEIAYGPTRGSGSGIAAAQLTPGKHFELKLNLSAIFDMTLGDDYTLSVHRKVRLTDGVINLSVDKLEFRAVFDAN